MKIFSHYLAYVEMRFTNTRRVKTLSTRSNQELPGINTSVLTSDGACKKIKSHTKSNSCIAQTSSQLPRDMSTSQELTFSQMWTCVYGNYNIIIAGICRHAWLLCSRDWPHSCSGKRDNTEY